MGGRVIGPLCFAAQGRRSRPTTDRGRSHREGRAFIEQEAVAQSQARDDYRGGDVAGGRVWQEEGAGLAKCKTDTTS